MEIKNIPWRRFHFIIEVPYGCMCVWVKLARQYSVRMRIFVHVALYSFFFAFFFLLFSLERSYRWKHRNVWPSCVKFCWIRAAVLVADAHNRRFVGYIELPPMNNTHYIHIHTSFVNIVCSYYVTYINHRIYYFSIYFATRSAEKYGRVTWSQSIWLSVIQQGLITANKSIGHSAFEAKIYMDLNCNLI